MAARFLTPERDQQIRAEFQMAGNSDVMFFERVGQSSGLGNTTHVIGRPYDVFQDYQSFLKDCQAIDRSKYETFHKGTPFFFLAWLALDLKDYEKALFYMDAAVSEDIRAKRDGWEGLPAANFLRLGTSHAAVRTTNLIRDTISRELMRFNVISGRSSLSLEDFVGRLYSRLGGDAKLRTILSALYTFLLEYEDRCLDLKLRSNAGGTSEPFLVHLFKGGLIFESLLKELYPQAPGSRENDTLSRVFKETQFKSDFIPSRIDASARSLMDIFTAIRADDMSTAFSTCAKLRNTAGHNLCWDDALNTPNVYQRFFEQEVNAILYIVVARF